MRSKWIYYRNSDASKQWLGPRQPAKVIVKKICSAPRLEFCRRQVFHRKLKNQDCSFTRDLIGAVASRCFPHPTLSLASEQTLKDLERSQGHQRGGEESGFG